MTGRCCESVLGELLRRNVAVFGIERTGENEIVFMSGARNRAAVTDVLKAARGRGVRYRLTALGLPAIIKKNSRRVGLFAGIVLSFLMMYASTLFVWTLDISGSERVGEEEIRSMLSEFGLSEGTLIKSVNADELRSGVLGKYPEISYLTVRIAGTCAYVSVSERTFPPKTKKDGAPCNLVAKRDGVIIRSAAYSGLPQVKSGESVKKGDLLVSGIVAIGDEGIRAVHASGEVIADTTDEFSVVIPLSYTKKVYTGAEMKKKSLGVLGIWIPMYARQEPPYGDYDMFTASSNAEFWGMRLPLRLRTSVFLEYARVVCTRTEEEALRCAYDAYGEFKKTKGRITEEDTDYVCSGTELVFHATVWCEEDIAEEREIQTGVRTDPS